jgi:hypothetical protein
MDCSGHLCSLRHNNAQQLVVHLHMQHLKLLSLVNQLRLQSDNFHLFLTFCVHLFFSLRKYLLSHRHILDSISNLMIKGFQPYFLLKGDNFTSSSMISANLVTALYIEWLINHIKQVEIMKSDNIEPETTCGYCTQGKHTECRGYDCACAENGHP